MNTSKVAIIGCGAAFQQLHAPALLELERRGVVSVRALFDPAPAAVLAARSAFPSADVMKNIDDAAKFGCEIALVASPARLHAIHSVACLKSGLAVLCEKPMAASSAEAEAMVVAAEKSGRPLAVGHMRRFFATSRLIKSLIATRTLGSIRTFSIKEGGKFGWPARSASFFEKTTAGGGVLIDTGIHTLDIILWWMGEPHSFRYEDDSMGGLETNCRMDLDYGDFRGTVQLSRDSVIPTGYDLRFERGWIRCQPYIADTLDIGFEGSTQTLDGFLCTSRVEVGQPVRDEPVPSAPQAFLQEWLNIVAAAAGRETPVVPGREAARVMRLVEDCYASRTFMEPPWFTDQERERARELHKGGIS